MTQKVFINLPVKNLEKSKSFFTSLGYQFNAQFTNEFAACMVVSDTIYAMLVTHDFFKTFTPHPISDASKQTEVLICLDCRNRAEVDETVKKAVAAGGTTFKEPQDHGFMYGHGFQDLDGHIWEFFYMDPAHIQPN